MLSACRQPGLEEGAALALNCAGGQGSAPSATSSAKALHLKHLVSPEPSVEELARLSAAGSLDSFEQIVLRFQSHVFNFLLLRTRHRQDAEDLTQETFCRVWRSLPRYNPSLSFAPWLFSIARHTAANHYRDTETFEQLPAELGATDEDPANLLAQKDDNDALWRVARTLKANHWEVLWFRYGEGFSTAETARAMRISQIHVKVLLHRARAALAKCLSSTKPPPNSGSPLAQTPKP